MGRAGEGNDIAAGDAGAAAHEAHAAFAGTREVGVEQGQLAIDAAPAGGACRPGGVPHDLHAARQGTRCVRERHGQIEREVVRAVARFGGEGGRVATGCRVRDHERLRRQHDVGGTRMRNEAAARVALEAQARRRGAGDRGRRERTGHPHVELEGAHLVRICERHPQPRSRGLDDREHHRACLAGQQRIDAQLVLVAERGLQQARVDAAARDVFEHLLRTHLLDWHRISQAAVDVEREAAHDLAFGERKQQLAFEGAQVRVAKHHLDARLGHAARNLHGEPERLHRHRLLGALHLHQRLPPRHRGRHDLGARLRACQRGGEDNGRACEDVAEEGA